MKTFDLSHHEKARFLAADPLLLQGAIATVANRRCGIEITEPLGIYRYEGGVVVNNHHIAIKEGWVSSKAGQYRGATDEEIAVAEAIRIVSVELIGNPALLGRKPCAMGNPLTSLLEWCKES